LLFLFSPAPVRRAMVTGKGEEVGVGWECTCCF
jgi:hypothetical protein